MTARVVKHPKAKRDLSQIAHDIARDNARAARRFVEHVERTCKNLAGMPTLASMWESDDPLWQNMRVWPIPRYRNYLIFFQPIANGIEVIRVIHGARDLSNIFAE